MLLPDGPAFQDYEATHVAMSAVVRRVRLYQIPRGAPADLRRTIVRAAQREFQILEGISHPAILRAERVVQLIYGTDERTRTRLLARLDPEKLERLPEAERRALGIPELEFLVLEPQAGGRVRGRAHLDSGRVRLAARRGDGKLELCSAAVPLAADGTFEVPIESLPTGTTHLFALLEKEQPLPAVLDQEHLPEGVEVLDAKPWR